jgi:NAD(P)H-nitrite reductase large subunit
LSAATRAGTGCGSCRGQLTRMLMKHSPTPANGSLNGHAH